MNKREPQCGIYGLKNSLNGKWYIGQSKNIHRRIIIHKSKLRKKKHGNRYLQAEFDEHGFDIFELHILEIVNPEMLDVREKAWISYHKSMDRQFGYNLDTGGIKGKKFSAESNARNSASNKGKKLSPEHVEKIRIAVTGRAVSQETREKISKIHKGKTISLEQRLNSSRVHKGKKLTEEQKAILLSYAKGRIVSNETRGKLRAAKLGKRKTPEQKENCRKSAILRWEKAKEAKNGDGQQDIHWNHQLN